MRILLVAPFFPPHRAVSSLRTHSFAAAWAAAGHDVTVLTTPKRADQAGLDLPAIGLRVCEVGYRVPRVLEGLRASERADRAGTPGPAAGPPSRWAGAGAGGPV